MSVRKLHLVRHSIASKLAPEIVDDDNHTFDKIMRRITPAGKSLATARRFSSPFLAEAQLLVVTPALRTHETGLEICDTGVKFVEVDELYPVGKDMDEIFSRLTYSPLAAYFADPNGQCIRDTGEYMASIMNELLAMNYRLKNIVHVGHAVIIQAMAVAMIGYDNVATVSGADQLMTVSLTECQGFTLTLDEKQNVTYVEHFA